LRLWPKSENSLAPSAKNCGWAADRTQPNTAINVSIYDGSTLVTTVVANQNRPDVGAGERVVIVCPDDRSKSPIPKGGTHHDQEESAGAKIVKGWLAANGEELREVIRPCSGSDERGRKLDASVG